MIRSQWLGGIYTYEEAEAKAAPVIAEMNERGQMVVDRWNRDHDTKKAFHPYKFIHLMR